MLNFLPGLELFAIAGSLAAAGPIIIHLLNRRRFRTLHWAAMDFLCEAVQRSRRILELRDLILLILRSMAVLLFGLALARPFVPSDSLFAWRIVLPSLAAALVCALSATALWTWPVLRGFLFAAAVLLLAVVAATVVRQTSQQSAGQGVYDPAQPLHAVILIDNSQSMGYRQIDGTLLERAKRRGAQFIERLPAGSRASIIPLCGTPGGYTLDPYADKQDAIAALDRIELADRRATASLAVQRAGEACERAAELAAKRVILLSDQQQGNWPAESLAVMIGRLPELQVVDVSASRLENTWISSLEVQDGLADVQTPATLLARIRHEAYDGAPPRRNVQVTLKIDGTEVATKTIDSIAPGPGGEVEVAFRYQFQTALEPGQVRFVPAEVSLPADRLEQDDHLSLAVAVVASVPVVFVDQYGADRENVSQGRVGETYDLRQLLAPTTRSDLPVPQLIEIRHRTIKQLDRKLLSDARLVVLAGIGSPAGAVRLLREYVQQGGRLLIAPGGEFDPAAWNDTAWLDGRGILPAPLDGFVGESLTEARGVAKPFFISYDSMTQADGDFQISGETSDGMRDLYRIPRFFKAVRTMVSDRLIRRFVKQEKKRLDLQAQRLAASDARIAAWQHSETKGTLSGADRQSRAAEIERRREWNPTWLLWKRPDLDDTSKRSADRLARRSAPRRLASFSNEVPLLVERRIGHGDVLFISSSISSNSSWNTLPTTNTFFLADRLMRRRIQRTLPLRNLSTNAAVQLPIDPNDQQARFELKRPDGTLIELSPDALGASLFGVTIKDVFKRGVYQVMAYEPPSGQVTDQPRWSAPITLSLRGPASESILGTVDRAALERQLRGAKGFRWVAAGEKISLQGATAEGQDLWWSLVAVALGCLAAEMVTLALPRLAGGHSA